MLYESERTKIVEVCKLMQELEFFIGTWGNVSIRVGDQIILTPSRIDYDNMRPEDLVVIDMDGNVVEGFRNPSSEKEVHRQVFLVRGDVGAIVHTHTKCAMALSATDVSEVPCIVEEMSQLMGGAVPVTGEYVAAKQHLELGRMAAGAIGDKNGVILKNHGCVACGRDIDEAVLSARVVEKACEMFLMLSGKLNIHEIPEKYIESERYRFLNTYGKEAT